MNHIEQALERALRDVKEAYRQEIALISREKADDELVRENNQLRKMYNLKYLECFEMQMAGSQLLELLESNNIQVPSDLYDTFFPVGTKDE